MLHHIESATIRYGPLRNHWCFVDEHIIKILQSYYSNTNNRKASMAVMRRHVAVMFIELMKQVLGEPNSCPRRFAYPISDTVCDIVADNVFCGETGNKYDAQLHKSSREAVTLNWQSLKKGDVVLIEVNGFSEVVLFVSVVSNDCGEECSWLLYEKPKEMLEKTKKEGGSVQWLIYSEEKEDRVFIIDAGDAFQRKLKAWKFKVNEFIVIDDVSELYED
ncbi:hypothetical protein HDU79_007917 [Rhizoclosmatium sp. JEL0117]|nr:hypothetical protein HDU79_007917 [Rhizoclosmatium sp. JEL0117]